MDVLNIVACMGVVLMHTTNRQIHQFNGIIDTEFVWGCITHTFSYWPVPVFLMLSGSNILRSDRFNSIEGYTLFYKKRFFKAFVPFVFWSILYLGVCLIKWRPSSAIELIEFVAQLKYNSTMWFFIPLFALYLCTPFIATWIANSTSQEKKLYILFSFIFCICVPSFFRITASNGLQQPLFPIAESMLFYPVIGFLITNTEITKKHKNTIYTLGAISVILHFSMLFFGIGLYEIKSSRVLNVCMPTSVFISVAVFLLFKEANWSKVLERLKMNKVLVTQIASCSLGVYLIQQLIFMVSAKLNMPFHTPYLGLVTTYPLALAAVFVMKKIPVVKNIVP